jgi:hypothetical protein
MIASVWEVTGFSIPAARYLTLLLTTLLPFSIAITLRPLGLSWAALTIGPGMLIHPSTVQLVASSMQELPAVALGAASVIPLVLLTRWPVVSYISSAFLAAFALVFKPTAAFGCILVAFHMPPRVWLFFGTMALSMFAALSLSIGSNLGLGFESHSYQGAEVEPFSIDLAATLAGSPAFLIVCCAAAFLTYRLPIVGPSRWIPVIFLCFLVIHIVHRPFWSYYAPHLVIPILTLFGVGVAMSIRASHWRSCLGVSALLACGVWLSHGQTTASISTGIPFELRTGSLIRSQVGPVRAILSEDPWLPLAAGAVPVPETVILPWKRVWIGDWTPLHAARAIQDRAPEVVALYPGIATNKAVQAMLKAYRFAGTADGLRIWTSTNLAPVSLQAQGRRDLKAIGL